MISMDQYTEIIGRIYDTVLDPELWPGVLGNIQTAVGGCGALLGVDVAGRPAFLGVTGYDSEAIDSFANIYAAKSFVWNLLPTAAEGLQIHDRRVLPPDRRRRDVFANEWARKFDTADCLVRPLLKRGHISAVSVFARSPGCGEFDREAMDVEERVMPHLKRAVQIKTALDRADVRAGIAMDVIDKLGDSVFFVTSDARVTYANQAAGRLLSTGGSGLRLQGSRLIGPTCSATASLRMLIANSAGRPDGGRAGGMLAIERPDHAWPLAVFCAPLLEDCHWTLDVTATALLLVSDTMLGSRTPREVFAALFRLTPAEAHLALHLARGESLAEAADRLGVAKATAISHLKMIFSKTHTNRQSQLIRLLHTLPRVSIADPAGPVVEPSADKTKIAESCMRRLL